MFPSVEQSLLTVMIRKSISVRLPQSASFAEGQNFPYEAFSIHSEKEHIRRLAFITLSQGTVVNGKAKPFSQVPKNTSRHSTPVPLLYQ